MMHRCAGWLDAFLSRIVVEPRFVSRQPSSRAAWLADMLSSMRRLRDDDWFAAPPNLEPYYAAHGSRRDGPTKKISWDMPEVAASRQLGSLPSSGRPLAILHGNRGDNAWILIHGWLGGNATRDRREWPVEPLLERGDVVHFVLPGHGARKNPSDALLPTFPSRNPVANAIGLAVAVAELRQLVGWLKRIGYRRVGIAGTSLGGYVAALYATVSDECDRLLLDRPLVRMSEPLRRVVVRCGDEYQELLSLLDAVYAPVSPLERPVLLAQSQIAVLLGSEDRVSGLEAGETLATHFGVVPYQFPGAHVLTLGRRRSLWERFCELDLSLVEVALR